jgi:general secretion pathway protein G
MPRRPTTRRAAFTLVEVMIVVVIMSIVVGAVIPQFTDSAKEARISGALMNVSLMRKQLELYKQHHNGSYPARLGDLALRTDAAGNVGTSSAHVYGPYIREVPINPFTSSAKVTPAASNPPSTASGAVDAGWFYHAASGGVWIDNADLLAN